MLVVISPAKRLDWSQRDTPTTEPDFLKDASILAGHARQLTLTKLKDLMGLSDDLARLNRDRFARIQTRVDAPDARPAALAFAGDTYQGLEATSLDADDMAYAQDHLRILSGLYGVLRPLDAIEPYRLEMGSRLKSRRGKTLYDFWGDTIAKALNLQAERTGSNYVVNCASQEYFGAVDLGALVPKVITPGFLEEKDGEAKTVSFFAKRARGAMARFIVETRPRSASELQDFEAGGYRFDPNRSRDDAPVFVRPYAKPQAA